MKISFTEKRTLVRKNFGYEEKTWSSGPEDIQRSGKSLDESDTQRWKPELDHYLNIRMCSWG